MTHQLSICVSPTAFYATNSRVVKPSIALTLFVTLVPTLLLYWRAMVSSSCGVTGADKTFAEHHQCLHVALFARATLSEYVTRGR